ncbi:MAG: RHS repeat-associated core domain-containing protein [Paludibacteraceae bacterium]|nr:RHS repeat-associated core domain-containing protein [Paludibacteraceae bacterium]
MTIRLNGVDSIHITYGVDFQRRKMEIFRKDSLILTRYYFSDYEEEHYADGRVRKIDYITGPTGLIGVNISTDGVDTLLYAFTDRFGNLVMLVDGNKNIVERLAYDPWGARRNPADWTKPDTASHLLARGYSMHEHIDCLGLINMNARVYEPATCSFLSPDPLIADEGNWLNYNRYLYCLGNPVKFADPTGMQIVTPSDLPLTGPTGVVPQNGGGFGIVNMNWTYDDYSQSYIMSYGYSDFVVNGANNSNDYFVNYALSGNAAYASSVTADHKNAIDWQIANASAKAMEGVNVGGQGWNTFGNINNGMAFVSSSAFEYVHQTLDRSTKYIVDGVSTTKDVHFKVPDVKIKGWQMPHINVYIHNVGAVRTASNILKGASWITGAAGMAMTGIEILNGQKNFFGEGGLDLVIGVVGFIPGWGWAVSGAYFGGKMILEATGNKFW